MRPAALLIFLCLAACGGTPADEGDSDAEIAADVAACSVPTGGVKINAQMPPEKPTELECTNDDLACEGVTVLKKRVCSDGFAVTLDRGQGKLMLRLKSDGGWTAGAQLNGEAFTGSLTLNGLPAPPSLSPNAGTKQRASFFLASDTDNATGTFSIDW